MSTHLAAISPSKGEPFELQVRPTPKPGPGELLVAVKSVALNPTDGIMRDQGLFIPAYPTVIGFDIAGLVLEVGDNVPTGSTDDSDVPGLFFRPGITRVAAYAASFWRSCDPDYGAFQERCLVPWQHAVPLPDGSVSWNHAATLPVATATALSAWDTLGILPARDVFAAVSSPVSSAAAIAGDSGRELRKSNQQQEALLVWGASSSVGTMGVQSAWLLRDDRDSSFAAVYATVSSANGQDLRSLGADRASTIKTPA